MVVQPVRFREAVAEAWRRTVHLDRKLVGWQVAAVVFVGVLFWRARGLQSVMDYLIGLAGGLVLAMPVAIRLLSNLRPAEQSLLQTRVDREISERSAPLQAKIALGDTRVSELNTELATTRAQLTTELETVREDLAGRHAALVTALSDAAWHQNYGMARLSLRRLSPITATSLTHRIEEAAPLLRLAAEQAVHALRQATSYCFQERTNTATFLLSFALGPPAERLNGCLTAIEDAQAMGSDLRQAFYVYYARYRVAARWLERLDNLSLPQMVTAPKDEWRKRNDQLRAKLTETLAGQDMGDLRAALVDERLPDWPG